MRSLGLTLNTPRYITHITNKDLLQSTGNHTQYFIITYKGQASEKEKMCVCVCMCICVYTYMCYLYYVCEHIYIYIYKWIILLYS